MKILQARNPIYTEDEQIDIEVLFEDLAPEWVNFTASPDDSEEHGVTLYRNALNGVYGEIASYEPPVYTPEEQAEMALAEAKAERASAVNAITVEVDGMVFDGDESAQERMSRAVTTARASADLVNAQRKDEWIASWGDAESADGIPEEPSYDSYLDYTTSWVLADNTIATVTIAQLAQACRLAGEAQTGLWVVPYEGN